MTQPTITPTLARTWRQPRAEGFVVTLPSGNVARLRPVALDRMILSGSLPDLLTPLAAKTLWTTTDEAEIGNQIELARGFVDLVNLIVPLAMMEPTIVEDPQTDSEISIEDIDFGDKVAVFQLATQPATFLKAFREQQAGGLATLHNGEGQPLPPQQPD